MKLSRRLGLARASFGRLYPDLAKRIYAKVKETTDAKRSDLFEIVKNKIRETVEELERHGAQPSIEVVWNAIPRLPHHGKTMVERILRLLRPNLVTQSSRLQLRIKGQSASQ